MAERNPAEPQVEDPELEAELIRTLSIVGPLGRLRVADIVIPTISLGNVVQQTVEVHQPAFRSTDIFSIGAITATPANTIHADTGGLAAGTYDVMLTIINEVEAKTWNVEHRNAANTANLAFWQPLIIPGSTNMIQQTFGYEFAINERLRISNGTLFGAGVSSVAWIFARRRT